MILVNAPGLRLPYRMGLALQIIGGVVIVAGFTKGALVAVGLVLWAAGFLYAILGIKCPSCGLKLAWYAYSERPAMQGPRWLAQVDKCPQCGWSGSPSGT